MADEQLVVYRAQSGAKVLVCDLAAKTIEIATQQHGTSEKHKIALDALVKLAYGERAAIVILPELPPVMEISAN